MAKDFLSIDGRKLAHARSMRLMPQVDLAELSGVSLGAIKKVEPKSRVGVQLRIAKKLAVSLGMTESQFIDEIGIPDGMAWIMIPASLNARIDKLAVARNESVTEILENSLNILNEHADRYAGPAVFVKKSAAKPNGSNRVHPPPKPDPTRGPRDKE